MKKGEGLIISGGVLFALGAFILPVIASIYMVSSAIKNKEFSIQAPAFKSSSSTEIRADEPGRYYLWNNYQTIHNGHSYNLSENLPNGIEFKFTDKDSGKPFVFKSYTGMTSSGTGSSKRTVGYINVTNACTVVIDISGGGEERIFSFYRSIFSLTGILSYVLITVIALAISIILIITGIIISSKKPKPPPLPQTDK
jgi:hypothetical protein